MSSACLVKNGKLISSSTEERFTRNKLTRDFPYNSIKFCLNKSNLKISDIDAVSIAWNPAINLEVYKKSFSQTHRWFPELLYIIPNNLFNIGKIEANYYTSQQFYSEKSKKKIEIFYINHHLCHLAQSFLNSGFSSSGLLSIDGFGERTSTAFGVANKKDIKILETIDFPHSLGSFYETVTEFLGYTADADEWKVMGMAAYGDKSRFKKNFDKLIKKTENNSYELNLNYFNHYNFDSPNRFTDKFKKLFHLIEPIKNNIIKKEHFDFAAAAQDKFEDIYEHLLRFFTSKIKSKNICLGGGAIMNCLANGRLSYKFPKKNFYTTFAPDDSGLSIGSALFLSHYIFNKKTDYKSVETSSGIEFNNDEIKKSLKKYKINFKYHKDIENIVSKYILENKTVGWFQGKAEFGQRALGNRSILANPATKNIKDIVNATVKYRESYRPFAPSCLKEDAEKFFKFNKNINPYYMQYAVEAKSMAKKLIPSVVHEDNTSRIQIVLREKNKRYHELLKQLKEKSGIGIVLNTSFNLKGEPVVNTPEDALRTFFSSGLDILCLGNFIIKK